MSEYEDSKDKLIPTVFSIVCMVLLLVALCELPYGYYTMLRLSLFIWGIIYGIKHYSISKNKFLTVLSFGISVLYNPIVVVHFERSHWSIINIISILLVYICSIEVKSSNVAGTDALSEEDTEESIKEPEDERIFALQNISRIVHTCLNVKVNGIEIFKSTPEKNRSSLLCDVHGEKRT